MQLPHPDSRPPRIADFDNIKPIKSHVTQSEHCMLSLNHNIVCG
jgi:hypothetical protein